MSKESRSTTLSPQILPMSKINTGLANGVTVVAMGVFAPAKTNGNKLRGRHNKKLVMRRTVLRGLALTGHIVSPNLNSFKLVHSRVHTCVLWNIGKHILPRISTIVPSRQPSRDYFLAEVQDAFLQETRAYCDRPRG